MLREAIQVILENNQIITSNAVKRGVSEVCEPSQLSTVLLPMVNISLYILAARVCKGERVER